MPYSPKKNPQRGSMAPGAPARPAGAFGGGGSGGNIDKGLMRPEWKERLKERAAEREAIERTGRTAPGRPGKLTRKQLRKDPFLIYAPSPETVEAERQEAERASHLHEILVPEAEKENIRTQQEAYRRGERPFYQRPAQGPSTPVSQRPGARTQAQAKPQAEPKPQPPGPAEITPEYLNGVFDLGKMWAHVAEMRKDPKFQAQKTAGIGIIAPAGIDSWGKVLKTSQFFGIPQTEIEKFSREEVWDTYIKPFLTEVERMLNSLKPRDLPGRFTFETSYSGAFGLAYTEK